LSKMFTNERREKILEILHEKKRVTVKELSEQLDVSEATLRSDLNAMEKERQLTRTHGGATIEHKIKTENTFSERKKKNQDEKKRIGLKASEHISSGQCIILDASSTALELARNLKETSMRLTVITNGIASAMELKENPNLTVILLGGLLRVGSVGVEGVLGASLLKQINVDTMFTSAKGFTVEEGLTDFNVYEVELKKLMKDVSKKVIALLDHTKMGKVSISPFATSSEINTIITDTGTSEEIISQLESSTIKIIQC
jgi:DeoR/GlpR family transcriptional regulator of sugar metabolism